MTEENPKAVPIGGDWFKIEDRSSGRHYYANSVTKETSWHFPDAVQQLHGTEGLAQESTEIENLQETDHLHRRAPSQRIQTFQDKVFYSENEIESPSVLQEEDLKGSVSNKMAKWREIESGQEQSEGNNPDSGNIMIVH